MYKPINSSPKIDFPASFWEQGIIQGHFQITKTNKQNKTNQNKQKFTKRYNVRLWHPLNFKVLTVYNTYSNDVLCIVLLLIHCVNIFKDFYKRCICLMIISYISAFYNLRLLLKSHCVCVAHFIPSTDALEVQVVAL